MLQPLITLHQNYPWTKIIEELYLLALLSNYTNSYHTSTTYFRSPQNSANEIHYYQMKDNTCKDEISKRSFGTDSFEICAIDRVGLNSQTNCKLNILIRQKIKYVPQARKSKRGFALICQGGCCLFSGRGGCLSREGVLLEGLETLLCRKTFLNLKP